MEYYLPSIPSIRPRSIVPFDTETGNGNEGVEIPDIAQTSVETIGGGQTQSTSIDNSKSIINPNFEANEDDSENDGNFFLSRRFFYIDAVFYANGDFCGS